jgi:hypothetical protein
MLKGLGGGGGILGLGDLEYLYDFYVRIAGNFFCFTKTYVVFFIISTVYPVMGLNILEGEQNP